MRTDTTAGIVALGLLGSVAAGEIVNINGDLSMESRVGAWFMGSRLDDDANAFIQVNPEQDDGLVFDLDAVRTTGIFAGGTGGMVDTRTSLMTGTGMYSYSHSMTNAATLGDGLGDHAESEHMTRLHSLIQFEEGDVVDIALRIEYEAVRDGQLWAQLRVSGIAGQGPVMLEVRDPTDAGFVEFTIRTTVDGPRAFFLDADLESAVEAQGDRRDELVDGFVMSASFTLVPAPGGLALLAPAGLIAAGRRRR